MYKHHWILCIAALSLAACGPAGGVASAGSSPAPEASAVAVIADATLPPPSQVSPLAKTAIDDHAVSVAFDALDTAAFAADTILALKPAFKGTPAARNLADALVGTKTWLNIASKAQRAGQADSYVAALNQASAALSGAKTALADLKGK